VQPHVARESHRVYNQDGHLGANWHLFSACLWPFFLSASAAVVAVCRVGRGFRRLGATSELGLDGLVHRLASHLFRYLVPVEFLLFTLDPLHRDRRVVFEGRSARRVQPMCLCLGVRFKVVYQPRGVVWRRETKVALAYDQS
jgi:hypothetical protein